MSALVPLQVLKFARTPRPSVEIGKGGELRWVPLKHLFIDPAYQRAILDSGKANILKMVEEFSWTKFGVLDVTRRGKDRYAVIDGQHRATAALIHGGVREVPCLILERTPAEEARAFAAINHNVTRIHPLQTFRAAVSGGDPEAMSVAKACAEAGVTIAPYPKNELRPGETMALGAVRACMKLRGAETLITALMILRAADPQSGLSAVAVKALCDAAPKHPEWHKDAAKCGEALTRTGGGLAALTSEAQHRKLARGGTLAVNFAALAEARIAAAWRTMHVPLNRLMAGR